MSFDSQSQNRLTNVALQHERRDRRTAPPYPAPGRNSQNWAVDHPLIRGRNDIGFRLDTGSIVYPAEPIVTNPSASATQRRRFLRRATEWRLTAPISSGLIAITLQESLPGQFVECAIIGVCECRVLMQNSAHPFARSVAGEYRWLESVAEHDSGAVPIVWREPGGAGAVVWARVALVEAVEVTTVSHCTFYIAEPFAAATPPQYSGPYDEVYMIRQDGQLQATPQDILNGILAPIPGGVVWEPPDDVEISTTGKAKLGRARRENNLWVAYAASCNEFNWQWTADPE